jgi:Helix-turn-helix domain
VVYEPIEVPGRVWVEHVGVLRKRDAGAVLRLARQYSGASQHRLAAAIGFPQSRVHRLLHDRTWVQTIECWTRIADGLNLPDDARLAIGLAPAGSGSSWETKEGDPMDRRQALTSLSAAAGVGATSIANLDSPADRQALLGAIAAITVGAPPADLGRWLPRPGQIPVSGKVTAEMVETVIAVTAAHRSLDSAAGGGACLPSAHGYLAWAAGLLSSDCESPGVESGLRSAVAELHGLVGWAAHDLGRHDLARRHLTQALALAREADDLPQMGYVLFQLGRVSLEGVHQGGPREALHLLALGRHAATQSGCPATAAILHGDTAWAYAHLGEPDQVRAHLTQAHLERNRADVDTTPAWARYAVSESDERGRSGVVHTTLASHPEHRDQADRAVEDMHAAAALRAPEQRRSQVFDRIYLASANLLTGDVNDATKHGIQAVTLAEAGMQSVRVVGGLTSMWDLAAPHVEDHPDLTALGARIHALQPTA